MTLKQHFRMTASEIAMGRYMRAPDHQAADDEFSNAFSQFGNDEKPAAGAAADAGGGDGAGNAGEAAATGGSGDAGSGDGGDAGAVGAEPAAADAGAAAAPAEGAASAADDGKGGAAAADDKGAAAGGDAKPAAAAAAPAAGETDDDVLKRLAAAVKKVGAEDKPAAEAEPAAAETPLFTAEESAKIENFRKEWPEVAEAVDLQSRAVAQSVLKYAFEQIGSVVNPMRETLDILATRTHYGDLADKVGTYTDEERQQIIDWVGKQPTYLQAPMMSVIEGGTAVEVADLVGRYREATGVRPAGAQTETPEAPKGDVELSDAAKQAAAALAPVSTKRSAVQAPDDKSDFNGAFAKFADELG